MTFSLPCSALLLLASFTYNGVAAASPLPDCATLAKAVDAFPDNVAGTVPFLGRPIDHWATVDLLPLREQLRTCERSDSSERSVKMNWIVELGGRMIESPCFSDLCVGHHPTRIKNWAPVDLSKAYASLRNKQMAAYYLSEAREEYKGPESALQSFLPYFLDRRFDNRFLNDLGSRPDAEFCKSRPYRGTYTSAGGNPTHVRVQPIGDIENGVMVSTLRVESIKRCFPGATAEDVHAAVTRIIPKLKGTYRIDGVMLDSRDPECGGAPSVSLGEGGVNWNASWLHPHIQKLKEVPMCRRPAVRID